MKSILYGFLLLFFTSNFFTYSQDLNKVKFNYIFVIDISGSMEGKGTGNSVIFPKLKSVINNFVDEIDNSNIYIYPFSGGIHKELVKKFTINSTDDKKKVKEYINSLQAIGTTTHIYDSFIDAINDATNTIETSKNNENNISLYYLYTDGKNEGGTGSLNDLVELYKLKRGNNGWLFYTSLGVEINKEDKDLLESYRKENLVYTQEPKGNVSSIKLIQPIIPILDFGNLKNYTQSSQTELFIITGKSEFTEGLKIKCTAQFRNLLNLGVGIKLNPDEFTPSKEQKIIFELINPEHIPEGLYEDTLYFSTTAELVYIIPDKINIKFLYQPDAVLTIKPENGSEIPFIFDDITPFNNQQSKKLKLDFNEQAKKNNIIIKLKFENDEDNPEKLIIGRDIKFNDNSTEDFTFNSITNELITQINYSNKLKEGVYKGKILIESSGVLINAPSGVDSLKENSTIKYIPIEFTIKVPWNIWFKVIIAIFFVCLFGALLWLFFIKKKLYPVFEAGQIQIYEPTLEEIKLKDKIKFLIGSQYRQTFISKLIFGEIYISKTKFDFNIILKPVKIKNLTQTQIEYDKSKVMVTRNKVGYLRHGEEIVITNIKNQNQKVRFKFINIKL